VLNRGVLWNIK